MEQSGLCILLVTVTLRLGLGPALASGTGGLSRWVEALSLPRDAESFRH